MGYKLLYTKTAFGDIQRLDFIARKRIKLKLEEYMLKPLFNAKKLTNSSIGSYRWRIGNFRVVFDIHGKDIVILRIGHRREIYKIASQ